MSRTLLVRYGLIPEVARFRAADAGTWEHGRRVVVRTHRGVEVGTILQTAQARVREVRDKLTARERTVLQLIVEGTGSSEIGTRLRLRPSTVEAQRENILRKLGLKTHQDLVQYALRRGVLPGGEPKPGKSGNHKLRISEKKRKREDFRQSTSNPN